MARKRPYHHWRHYSSGKARLINPHIKKKKKLRGPFKKPFQISKGKKTMYLMDPKTKLLKGRRLARKGERGLTLILRDKPTGRIAGSRGK